MFLSRPDRHIFGEAIRSEMKKDCAGLNSECKHPKYFRAADDKP